MQNALANTQGKKTGAKIQFVQWKFYACCSAPSAHFCRQFVGLWPPPGSHPSADPGISWPELTISFRLATGMQMSIRMPGKGEAIPYAIDSPEVQLLPWSKRCARLQADALRTICANFGNYETMSHPKLIPTYLC